MGEEGGGAAFEGREGKGEDEGAVFAAPEVGVVLRDAVGVFEGVDFVAFGEGGFHLRGEVGVVKQVAQHAEG